MFKWVMAWLVGCLLMAGVQAAEVGMVTSLSGRVELQEGTQAPRDIKPFIKLRESDKLVLHSDTRLQIVFFANGLQETWRGPGQLQLGKEASRVLKGEMPVEQKSLPLMMVRQLSATPAAQQGQAGMVRMRSLRMQTDLPTLEQTYAQLRQATPESDHNPELYLLAGYFELKEFDKIRYMLNQLTQKYPRDLEVAVLNSLYLRSIRDSSSAANERLLPGKSISGVE